jgi:hypothetical protein
MTSTHKRTAPGDQSPPTSAVTAVEFSHLEKVSARDSEAPTTPPTRTPFLA